MQTVSSVHTLNATESRVIIIHYTKPVITILLWYTWNNSVGSVLKSIFQHIFTDILL